MKQTLKSYVRKDKEFRHLLLRQDGGIIKYWVEHPNKDFDADLFVNYEKQIAEDYLMANKQSRTVRSLPADKLREMSLNWYRQSKGSELKFLVALKPELNAIDEELFKQLLICLDIYMADAYQESYRSKYPEGIPPKDFYDKVVEQYGPFGLSLDCLERVLQEYRGKAVNITIKSSFLKNIVHQGESSEWEEVNNLQTEFDIRMFCNFYFTDGNHKKIRQAIKEIIDNNTQNLTKEGSREMCRKLAIEEMKRFKQFTRWVTDETYPMEESKEGVFVPLITPEERQWLQHDLLYENSPGATGTQKLTSMGRHFCHYINILRNIGTIWAAQLLLHGIDMKDLEKETGITMNRNSGFLYYVDKFCDCSQRGECFIYDWAEAKKLLANVKHKKNKIETWEEEKQYFKNAVLGVMAEKKKSGDYLFNKPTHWKAIYRFAIDCGIMYDINDPNEPKDKSDPQYAIFEKFAHELKLDVNPPTRIPFTKKAINNITKKSFVRYNEPYPWPKDGLTGSRSLKLYQELADVYKKIKVKYKKIFSLPNIPD